MLQLWIGVVWLGFWPGWRPANTWRNDPVDSSGYTFLRR